MRYSVKAHFTNWIGDTVVYGSRLTSIEAAAAVTQILVDVNRWIEEGQTRVMTSITVEVEQ